MKKVKRIILFRFHDHFSVCQNNLKILRKLNPGIKIYGLYGGNEKNFSRAKKLNLEHVWMIPIDDAYWKWRNCDLAARWWYKEYGRKVDFDMLHVIEWDLLLLKPVDVMFKHISSGVAITNKKPLSRVYDTWTWVKSGLGREEWLEMKKVVRKKYNYRSKPWSGIFPGAAMSKKFLAKYSSIDVMSTCNDEVRMPLYAQCFKMPVHDTKLKNNFFNASDILIKESTIIKNKNRIFSFHPVRSIINL